MPLGLVFPDNGAHLSPFLARLCHGQICPTSCQPSEPRFSEPGWTAVRHSGGSLPHSGKRQANHWPGSTNQAEDCHITLRPGRPKLPNFNFKCQISGQNLLSQAFLIPGYFGLRDELSRHNVVGCTELCTSLMGEGKCRGNTCQTVSVMIKR